MQGELETKEFQKNSKIMEKQLNNLFKSMDSNIGSLIALFTKENKLLEQAQIPNIPNLLEKKTDLFQKLWSVQDTIKAILDENIIEKNAKLLEKVKANYQNLQGLIQNNEILLRSNIEVSSKIIDIYQKMKIKETIDKSGYDNTGKISALKKLEKIMPSVSLNNKI